jgi:lipoprotein-anchoring transpeptidase ErfK/SrfK
MPANRRYIAGLLAGTILPASAPAGEPDASLRGKLAWQIALERVAFSPGLIDGRPGAKTELATREFQRVHGLPVTGLPDEATTAALKIDPAAAITTYRVQRADLDGIGPAPKDWIARSKLKRLGYASLSDALAEKFHCTRGLLSEFNSGKAIDRLEAGDELSVPAVDGTPAAPHGERIEVDLSEKVIRVLDGRDQLVGLFHCSIAADRARAPSGDARVSVVAENPEYTFDPKMWPEVKGVDHKLTIPPGPRNPVGVCWIGLSLPGYGIHGSPTPEMIGKTGSHGCFRLTNWDALRLSRMIRVGTPVRFAGGR